MRGSDDTILIDKGVLHSRLESAIDERHAGRASEIATEFMEFVARRSGLLLPRTESNYAFVHLSFLEYFAAWWLERHVSSPEWVEGNEINPDHGDLKRWAAEPAWSETLLFLFQHLGACLIARGGIA